MRGKQMEEQVEEKEIKVFKEIVEWCFCIFLALIIALATRYYIFTSTVVKQFSRTKRNKKRGRSRFIKQNCNLQLQTKRNMGKTFIQYSRTN